MHGLLVIWPTYHSLCAEGREYILALWPLAAFSGIPSDKATVRASTRDHSLAFGMLAARYHGSVRSFRAFLRS